MNWNFDIFLGLLIVLKFVLKCILCERVPLVSLDDTWEQNSLMDLAIRSWLFIFLLFFQFWVHFRIGSLSSFSFGVCMQMLVSPFSTHKFQERSVIIRTKPPSYPHGLRCFFILPDSDQFPGYPVKCPHIPVIIVSLLFAPHKLPFEKIVLGLVRNIRKF